MPAFITRELLKTDQLSPNPLVETTTEVFYLGGLEVVYPTNNYPGGWNGWAGAYYGNSYPYQNNMYPYGGCGGNPYAAVSTYNFLRQHRLTRDELIDLQSKITAALAIAP
jgi:hypothetical protein